MKGKAVTALCLLSCLIVISGCSEKNKATQAEIDSCKDLIFKINGYEKNRMEYTGSDSDGEVQITYKRSTANKEWNLRCKKGTAQVWAAGAKMWMDI